ncbi:MAG: leucine-rich repeat domain-containing protein, partial [Myxococcales bacterium]
MAKAVICEASVIEFKSDLSGRASVRGIASGDGGGSGSRGNLAAETPALSVGFSTIRDGGLDGGFTMSDTHMMRGFAFVCALLSVMQLSCGGRTLLAVDAGQPDGGGGGTGGIAAGGAGSGSNAGASGQGLPEPPRCGGDPVVLDPVLDAKVHEALHLAPGALLSAADVATLTELIVPEGRVSTFGGLECLTSLELLVVIGGGSFADLSPLTGLTKLRTLYLAFGKISDVAPLARLPTIDWLYLDANQVVDVSPLARLPRLTNLSVIGNQVHDVTPLLALQNLIELMLDDNPIDCADPAQRAALSEFGTRIESLYANGLGCD